jgi:hypothetical protein
MEELWWRNFFNFSRAMWKDLFASFKMLMSQVSSYLRFLMVKLFSIGLYSKEKLESQDIIFNSLCERKFIITIKRWLLHGNLVIAWNKELSAIFNLLDEIYCRRYISVEISPRQIEIFQWFIRTRDERRELSSRCEKARAESYV